MISAPRVLELYSGIGGCAVALLPTRAEIVAAMDIHRGALDVYTYNLPHPTQACTLDALSVEDLRAYSADIWWLSPPCQPFTRRGLGRDIDDPRSRSLVHLLGCLEEVRPRALALENVPGFAGSRLHQRLRQSLTRSGFAHVEERIFCPTELGVPNRRQRFYLLASQNPLLDAFAMPMQSRPLASYLVEGADDDPALRVDPDWARKYEGALHVVDRDDATAVSNCFTSAYGRSPVRSGSYLRTSNGLRFFAPIEILRLLGFPETYRLPANLNPSSAWRLVGNSLSIFAVRSLLSRLPEFVSDLGAPLHLADSLGPSEQLGGAL